ncbi:MAG: beta-lactamase family protein [Proteobacteria bacterium]|nr:beta-lactamase family protein [Pseudomonadota bacterium]
MSAAIEGRVEPGYEPVREAFEENFRSHGDVGAAVCVYRHGRPVVDLWGGRDGERAWRSDQVVMVFSSTKGVTATCAHLLAQRGELDLDAPVADYWPEFAAQGKGEIPVLWLLCHRAGLAAVEGEFELADVLCWDPVIEALAAQKPNWTPGDGHGYHARSYGWCVGEVIRRVSGRSVGRFWAEEIAAPLGLDFWIGLPESIESRCAALLPPQETPLLDAIPPGSLGMRVMTGPGDVFAGGYDQTWNRREVRAAEIPSSNGIGDARSLARLYAATVGEVDGLRLLEPKTVRDASASQARGPDRVLGLETHFGSGYALPPMLGAAVGPRAFGHPGAGGSLGFADPEAGLGFGYAMNQMKLNALGDERGESLVRAAYACLG